MTLQRRIRELLRDQLKGTFAESCGDGGNSSADWEIYGYNVVTFGDQVAGLILELVKGLAADLGQIIDAEASNQIRSKTYVDDGAGGGSRRQVNRFRGSIVDGRYTGTIPQILGLVGQKLKVMVASGDVDEDALELLGDKVLGHCWKPTEDVLVFHIVVDLTPSKFKKKKTQSGSHFEVTWDEAY